MRTREYIAKLEDMYQYFAKIQNTVFFVLFLLDRIIYSFSKSLINRILFSSPQETLKKKKKLNMIPISVLSTRIKDEDLEASW